MGVAQCLIIQVVLQCAMNCYSAVQLNWSTDYNQVQISRSFGLTLLGAQRAYKCRSIAILIEPALEFAHVLAYSKINTV